MCYVARHIRRSRKRRTASCEGFIIDFVDTTSTTLHLSFYNKKPSLALSNNYYVLIFKFVVNAHKE
tara:strand:+ start:1196 stop:1393 length:198 start_codon:yes stop_codon:yes gene_type:complete